MPRCAARCSSAAGSAPAGSLCGYVQQQKAGAGSCRPDQVYCLQVPPRPTDTDTTAQPWSVSAGVQAPQLHNPQPAQHTANQEPGAPTCAAG